MKTSLTIDIFDVEFSAGFSHSGVQFTIINRFLSERQVIQNNAYQLKLCDFM